MGVSNLINDLPTYVFQAIVAGIVLVGAYLVNRLLLQRAINRFALSVELEPHYGSVIKKSGSFVVYLVAFFIILANLGISGLLYGLLASAGFAGIVVGMAAREALADILNGIMLMIEKPFKVGDPVVIGGESGQVEAIGFRSVTLKAWSGEKVLIPNSKVSESTIKNFDIDIRRADVFLLVDYQANIRRAMKICKDVLMENREVLKEPNPTMLVGEFKNSGIELQLFYWLPSDKFFSVDTEIRQQILERLSKEGIQITLGQIRVLGYEGAVGYSQA